MRSAMKVAVVAGFLLVLASAVAAAQSITRVSESADGTIGGASVGPSAVSDDGRFVAFRSGTANLVAGDTNGVPDVFVKDMQTGAIERVNVSSTGVQANGDSGQTTVGLSADGRYVLFDSLASNLVAGDTTVRDLFVRDRLTGTTTKIMRDDGAEPAGASSQGAISGNGRYVAFIGAGHTAGGPVGVGVYVADLQTGDVERLMATVSVFEDAAISDDGRHVAFTTREFNSNEDVILFDRDTDTWEIANPRIGGAAPQSRVVGGVAISGNGRFVAFGSPDTNYVAGDAAGTFDVFVYDSTTDALQRIATGVTSPNEQPRPVLSDTGRYVAFASRDDAFDPPPGNGRQDVVVFDRNTGTGGTVSLFSDGSLGNGNSLWPGISGTGRFVTFVTPVPFDADDISGTDVYLVDRQGTTSPPPGDECSVQFTDVAESNVFADDICWLAEQGITRGCNPPANTSFCPKDSVTRGQMAAFLVRALGYTDDGGGDLFIDDDTSVFERDIDRLGTAGVTRGCNPPANDRFCPTNSVTRGQMAAFLVRALGYTDDGGGDLFIDDDTSVFERDIDRLGTAGVTRGCNPPANDRFCPTNPVTREQMAAFLRRALEG